MAVAAIRNDGEIENRAVEHQRSAFEHEPFAEFRRDDVLRLVHQRNFALLELIFRLCQTVERGIDDVVNLLRTLARHILVEREHHFPIDHRHSVCSQIFRVNRFFRLAEQRLSLLFRLLVGNFPFALRHRRARQGNQRQRSQYFP